MASQELEDHFALRREQADLGDEICTPLEAPDPEDARAYEIDAKRGMEWIRSLFEENIDYTMNWLLLSVSGICGSYCTLDDLEGDEYKNQWDAEGFTYLTVIVIQARMHRTFKGHIHIRREDIPWLRERVKRTLEGIAESQRENL